MAALDRIRWHCRRGLLELDLVLADFLAHHLETLDAQQLENFRELLEYQDNDLLDLVMGRAELCDTRCQPILNLLRTGQLEHGT
jgi:succinate dehydrogenase flavin-adding protein (antitoxin of CptAB toxin-antitoxin module)